MRLPCLTCQLHPCACSALQEQLNECRKSQASLDKHIVLALHLVEQDPVDHITDSIGFALQKHGNAIFQSIFSLLGAVGFGPLVVIFLIQMRIAQEHIRILSLK